MARSRTEHRPRSGNRSAFVLWAWTSLVLGGCLDSPSPQPAVVEETSDRADGEPTAPEPDPTTILPSELREKLGVSDANSQFDRRGGRIVSAAFDHSGITDLTPLTGLVLQSLNIRGDKVRDLSPLREAPLVMLGLTDTAVADLSPLAGRPLETVVLERCPVTDIAPIASPTLAGLQLAEVPVADLSPLAKTGLNYLWVEKTQVTDISALKGLTIPKLYLKDSPIVDISPLSGKTFEELDLSGTKVADLGPTRTMKLGILWLKQTPVTDLTPVVASELTSLDVQDTPVTDLRPLAGMPTLQRLNIAGSQVTDLTPLAGLNLTRLIFTPDRITKGIEVVRAMPTLRELDVEFDPERRPAFTPEQFWRQYDAGAFAAASPSP